MYLVKTPWLLKAAYPTLTWKVPTHLNEVFITFDDGPHKEITPFVLETLQKNYARATFFCLGKNVEANKKVFASIIDDGHAIGNHTYNHYNGWKTDDETYLKDVMKARKVIDSKLFRPPYGRAGKFQIQQLKKFFNIIMWDVLSGDFDINLSPEKCLKNVISNTEPGSIIVFHDSEKAFKRLEYTLPRVLENFAEKGFTCKPVVL
jgi:peptidoglycan-N-acetylglucosamine deacetylase